MIREIQLGKNGITEHFVESLLVQFNKVQTVKISVLRSARENKEDVKKYADQLLTKLGEHYTAKVIGFTIILKKWRRSQAGKSDMPFEE